MRDAEALSRLDVSVGIESSKSERPEGYRPEPDAAKHPIFQWPPKPGEIFKYLFGFPGYLWPYATFFAGVALLYWLFLTPELSKMRNASVGWIALLFVGNVALLLMFAGFLHLRLYVRKAQGTKYKYNKKWLSVDNPTFLFRDQVWDNVFWTVCSAVPVWTAYQAATFWLQANGFAPTVTWQSHPVYCVLLLIFTQVWIDLHFSTTHRLLHWSPLFRWVHSVHHKNINTGPWSGLAMHPLEHVIYFSGVMLFWIVPSHPLHSVYLLVYHVLGDIVGHHGFDRLVLSKRISINTNHYMHYLHHKYVRVNYGTGVLNFDRLFGTFHNGSDESTQALMSRNRVRAHRSRKGGEGVAS